MRRDSGHNGALAGWVLWVFAAFSFPALAAEQAPVDFRAAVHASRASVVIVEGVLPCPVKGGKDIQVANTGFFASADGHVLTSLFAVCCCRRLLVRTYDGRQAEATVLALDQPSGLALLTTDLKQTKPLEFSPQPPERGQWVLAASGVKSPEGRPSIELQPGLLLSCEASLKLSGFRWEGLLATEMPLKPGAAAGPMLDLNGRLVGVVLGVRAYADGTTRCYALSAQALEPILDRLMQGKGRRLGWLGMAVMQSGEKEGLTVLGVLDGSPSHKAGVRPGDVLLEIDGATISHPGVFESKVARITPGSEVAVVVLRGRDVKALRLEVGARPLLITRWPFRATPGADVQPRKVFAIPDADDNLHYRRIEDLREQNQRLLQRISELEERIKHLEEAAGAPRSDPVRDTGSRSGAGPETDDPQYAGQER